MEKLPKTKSTYAMLKVECKCPVCKKAYTGNVKSDNMDFDDKDIYAIVTCDKCMKPIKIIID